jgi:hypothetical protein
MRMDRKNIDTSNLLNDDDFKDIEKINKIKKYLTNLFNPAFIATKIGEMIENSDLVDFSSARSKKFIDSRKPVFTLKFDRGGIANKYVPEKKFESKDEEVSWIANAVYSEVIAPFSLELFIKLKDQESYENERVFNVEDISADDERLGRILFSTLFGMKIEIEKELVVIEYFR